MSNWKDDKDLGPWGFTEQPDKWGYLNNPKWSNKPKGVADSISASEFCENIGLPLDPEETHRPCGHWHKNATITSTVYENSIIAAITPIYASGSNSTSGVAVALYNITSDTWYNAGVFKGEGRPYDGEPNGFSLNEEFCVYYSDWLKYGTTINKLRVIVFENGATSYTDLWAKSIISPITSWKRPANKWQGTVVSNNTGLIACIAYLLKESDVDRNCWVAKVSEDKGATWNTTHYFPTVDGSNYVSGLIRIDDSSNLYVSYFDYDNKNFVVYKSTDTGASWSLESTTSLGTYTPFNMWYTIDGTGQYQYVYLYTTIGATFYLQLYKSTDYGASFSLVSSTTPTTGLTNIHTSNGADFLVANYNVGSGVFKKSTDYGSSFTDITPPWALTKYFVDHERDGDYDIYTECGEDFASGDNMAGFLYSLDAGATFSATHIPDTSDFSDAIFQNGFQPNVSIKGATEKMAGVTVGSGSAVAIDEPQVWTMDF